MSNNPFVLASDPNDPSNRFPKLDANGSPVYQQQQQPAWNQQQQWAGPSQPAQPQYPQQTGYGQAPQQYQQYQQPYLNAQPTGAFQPSSSFGQQLQAHYGPGPVQQQQNGNQAAYQLVADLDPYSSLASLPWAQPQRTQPEPPSSPTTAAMGGSSYHADHPRSYVQAHRTELEKWDTYTWKQFLQSVEKLKDAWNGRKSTVIKAMEQYNQAWTQADAERCQMLLREADSNIDTVTVSEFQLQEVQSGYRHSRDNASRARVREALNAGLRALPEWPEELQTSTGATIGYGGGIPPQQQQQQHYGGYGQQQPPPQQQQYQAQWGPYGYQ